MTAIEIAKKIIKSDEESNRFKTKPYFDHLMYPTIGWGFRIPGTSRHDPLPDITMTKEEGELKLNELLQGIFNQLNANDQTRFFAELNFTRQAVLISMAYQSGVYGVLKFGRMLKALHRKDYAAAADEIIDSATYRDPLTRPRFQRNADMMRTGKLLDYYK